MTYSALQKIVNRGIDDHPLPTAVYTKSSDFNAVLASNVFHDRRLSANLDKLLASVSLGVDVANVSRCHFLLERQVDRVLGQVSAGPLNA